ncbi:MAG: geopeptide radical SAM maturase [Desulfurivibrionaceae bacterium]
MPLSRYLIVRHLPGHPEQQVLFSTRTGGLALLPVDAPAAVRAGNAPPELTDSLAKLSMLVDDPLREQQEVHGYLAEINRCNPNLRVSVILGMACNFACRYCYEGSLKDGSAMDEATAEQLIRYLLVRYTTEKNRLILDFYGGEPLLYPDLIRFLASRLKPLIEARGGKFEFTLVSNGSLLSPALVEELLGLGLVSAKITVDGPEANHNHFRPHKNGRGSWATILANLKDCYGLLPIFLSGNYTCDNFRRFPELLDSLAAMGLGPEAFSSVMFYPVMQVNDRFANPEFSGGCCSMQEPWLVVASLFIREEILKRGYRFPKLRPSPCMVDLDDAFCVNHDGTLYKCVTLIGHPEFACGDISQGFNEEWRQRYCLDHWQKEERCLGCIYLPLCFGGCRYMAFQREGSMARVDCQKEFLDATLEKMLMQDLEYRYAVKGALLPQTPRPD